MRLSDWSSDVCSSDLHFPAAVRQRVKFEDASEALDLGAGDARRLGVGLGHAGGIDVALHRIVKRAEEALLVDQGLEILGLIHRDDLGLQAQNPRLSLGGHKEIEPGDRKRTRMTSSQ